MSHPVTPPLSNPHDFNNAPSRLPAWAQWTGIAVFGLLFAASGFWALTEHWRRATFALGVGMLWLAVLRLTCDSDKMGILAVRSRRFDAAFSAALGALMAFLSASVDALGS
ncbi:DUF3017 domain-containing protein [Corynebacterium incognita]|uniref:DUF3017 domain-containing protein n=1 Tax=Corynebacterium incognita TaxID=2754725 RepID=A0A7G7CN32_9CORY|nr:DUF3017 domain-containing protein [Corynebacterium incognita]QNE88998.1 DUF3017 domain-containing protein [Corynebacterium incognita]